MPSADVRDLRVYYELEGEGPRLLLISGSGDDERRKPNIFSTRFGSEFEILAYNQRGHAPTTIPDGPYTMRDYAEDTNALLEAVGWDSCLVMGISFGGTVGQEFALRFPQRIERLLLNCTSSGGQGRSSYPLIDLLDLDPTERFHTLIRLTNYGDAFLAANAALIQESLDQYLVAADDPLATLGQRLLLEARAEHDVYDRLPGLTMPVHVCGGRDDAIAPPENAQAIAAQIPNARLEFFEGGHAFYATDPNAVPRMIQFFRGELDSEPAPEERAQAATD